MKTEEFIDTLKELIRCYDYCNDEDSPINEEISMWRHRFLKENNVCDGYIEEVFWSIPSETFLSYENPEKLLKVLKKST